MSELIAVVDLETTGVDPAKDSVIEAAWALVDVATAQVVELHSRLYRAEANPAEAVNGIPLALLMREAVPARDCPPIEVPEEVTALVAHNAAFDRQWGAFASPPPWLCTAEDFRWPRAAPGHSLAALALAHGVGVVSAHRAYTDVLTLCALLARVHEVVPLSEQLAYARLPRATYVALAPFSEKDTVKGCGFKWVPERKEWRKRMLEDETKALPFKVRKAIEAELAGRGEG